MQALSEVGDKKHAAQISKNKQSLSCATHQWLFSVTFTVVIVITYHNNTINQPNMSWRTSKMQFTSESGLITLMVVDVRTFSHTNTSIIPFEKDRCKHLLFLHLFFSLDCNPIIFSLLSMLLCGYHGESQRGKNTYIMWHCRGISLSWLTTRLCSFFQH